MYDVDTLANSERLPIVLEMTCYTSAFHQPSFSGTTIDERLLLHPHGGAAGVWGPTGMGVSHGHDRLQRGFYQALWSDQNNHKTLGDLTMAGYLELYRSGLCCQDALRTYALLGDPLTTLRVATAHDMFLPFAQR